MSNQEALDLEILTTIFRVAERIIGSGTWPGDLTARVCSVLELPVRRGEVARRLGICMALGVLDRRDPIGPGGTQLPAQWRVLKPGAKFQIVDGHRFEVKEG